jgi:hypothetical protein
LSQLGIQADFVNDPIIETLDFVQQVLDLLCGQGAYRVRGSGCLWGRNGKDSWRIEPDGVVTAFCSRQNPVGFALLGARCRDLRGEGYELPVPLLRIIAGATLLAEIAQAALQLDHIAGATAAHGQLDAGAVRVATAVFTQIANTDSVMPKPPGDDTSWSPAGLLSCSLAFDNGSASPEAALASFSLGEAALTEYMTALRRAVECPPVREVVAWLPPISLPPDRAGSVQLLATLRAHGHPLAEAPGDKEDAVTLALDVPVVRDEADSAFDRSAVVALSAELRPEPLPVSSPKDNPTAETDSELSAATIDVATRLDALLAAAPEADPYVPLEAATVDFDSERTKVHSGLLAIVREAADATAIAASLRDQVEQLERNLTEAKSVATAKAEALQAAETRLGEIDSKQVEAAATALTAVLTTAETLLTAAADLERSYATELRPLFGDPEFAALRRIVDDYEAMRISGQFDSLPESAARVIEASAVDARRRLSLIAPPLSSRRTINVPLVVGTHIVTSGSGDERRLRIDTVVPIGAGEVYGPTMRLAGRYAQALREVTDYLDVPAGSVSIHQLGMIGGSCVIRLDTPVPPTIDAGSAAEAVEVMLESAIADDEDALLPVLLAPRVREVTRSVLDALPWRPPTLLPSVDRGTTSEVMSLETAAASQGYTPLELAVLLAMHGMPLEENGQVRIETLEALGVAIRLKQSDPNWFDGPEVGQGELTIEDTAALERGVYDSIRRDDQPKRRAARAVLLRLIREHRWAPGCTDVQDALRLLPPNLLGEGRSAIVELERAGWLVRLGASNRSDANVGLVGAHREPIIRFVKSGEGLPPALAASLDVLPRFR